MRLSNKSKIPVYKFINTFLMLIMFLGVLAYFFEIYRVNILNSIQRYLLLLVPIILFGIIYLRGKQIFEYDSDGEALNFKNYNIVPFLGKSVSDEFPKYKLIKYDILNAIIFKQLYIVINSKKSHQIRLKYDISYLTSKEIRDLRISLNKVVKANKTSEDK